MIARPDRATGVLTGTAAVLAAPGRRSSSSAAAIDLPEVSG